MNAFRFKLEGKEIKYCNRTFNDYFLNLKKNKKFLFKIIDENDLIKYLEKNQILMKKKFDIRDFINLNFLKEIKNQKSEKYLFLKMIKKEIKYFLNKNSVIIEKSDNIFLNSENKLISEDKKKDLAETDKNTIEKNFIHSIKRLNNANSNYIDKNKNELEIKEFDNIKIHYLSKKLKNSQVNLKNVRNQKLYDFNSNVVQRENKMNSKYDLIKDNMIYDYKENFKEYFITNEDIYIKFEEFKINLNNMKKIYLENLYPIELNVYKFRDELNNSIDYSEQNFKLTQKENKNISKKINSPKILNYEIYNNNNEDDTQNTEEDEKELTEKIFTNLNHRLENRNFMEICDLIENNFHGKNKYYFLGVFKSNLDKKYYQINFKKNFNSDKSKCSINKNNSFKKNHENNDSYAQLIINPNSSNYSKKKFTIDFFILRINKIQQDEKLQGKLKSKFLGKIAHEFKTPINSILGLIKRIIFNLENKESDVSCIPKDIKQVENLCTYTLFLIDDIIEYSYERNNFSNNILNNSNDFSTKDNKNSNFNEKKANSKRGFSNKKGIKFLRNKFDLLKNQSFDNLALDLNNKIHNERNFLKSIKCNLFNKRMKNNINKIENQLKTSQENMNSYDLFENKIFFNKNIKYYELESSDILDKSNIQIFHILDSKSENISEDRKIEIFRNKNFFNNSEFNSESETQIENENKLKISKQKLSITKNDKKKNNMLIKIEEINLFEIIQFCKEVSETLLISKGKEGSIKIFFSFDEEIHNYKIILDEFRIKQILLNFLSNSVKFTKSGYILIKSYLIENNSKIKISIIDTGVGIKEEDIKYLFTDKFMCESTKFLNTAGSGLGLSISKSIADKLGLKIEVNSDYGKGSEFSLIFSCKGKRKNLNKSKFATELQINNEEFNIDILNEDSNCYDSKYTKSKFKRDKINYKETEDKENDFIRNKPYYRLSYKDTKKKKEQIVQNKINYKEDLNENQNSKDIESKL